MRITWYKGERVKRETDRQTDRKTDRVKRQTHRENEKERSIGNDRPEADWEKRDRGKREMKLTDTEMES